MNKTLSSFCKNPVIISIAESGLWNQGEFSNIDYFDCIRMKLIGKKGGSYSTTFAISPVHYRKKYKTNAKVEVSEVNNYIKFKITDDYGKISTVNIPSYMKKEIALAINAAKEQDLLVG